MFRWPNLLMMAIALILVRYCILLPIYNASGVALQTDLSEFILLIVSTLSIGSAGYVVNDILDAGLDDVNKPGMNQVGNRVPEKMAWNIYYGLNIGGIATGVLLAYLSGKTELGILFLLIATALYYYSLKYKYLPFWGNLVISILTAMTVLIVWLFEFFSLKQSPADFITISPSFSILNRLIFIYSALAFYFTLLRELIKDAQDEAGDARFGARTIPVVLGKERTKWLIAFLLMGAIAFNTLAQLFFAPGFRLLAIFLSAITLMSFYSLLRLFLSKDKAIYHHLSQLAKAMLATGLISMVFLWFTD